MPGGYGQFAGNEFLQGPMANVAVGYGAAVASQGKEYVEKHVCQLNIIQIHFLIHGYWMLFSKNLSIFVGGLCFSCFFMFFHVCSFSLLEILLLSNFEAAVGFRKTIAPVNIGKKNEGFWKLKWNDAIVQKILINQSWMKSFCFFFQIDRFVSVSKLKYYFAVDTSYVVKKLGLLVFPFTHKVCRYLQLCLFNNFFA